MKISEHLKAFAAALESENNEALMLAEHDDLATEIVAHALVQAADILRQAAAEAEVIEPFIVLTPEKVDELGVIAEEFDSSGDDFLQKQASVLDELLLSIAAPKNARAEADAHMESRIDELRKKYQGVKEDLNKSEKTADNLKAIQKSPYYKDYRILEAPLNTRYCPDHPGVQIARVGEHEYQCSLDKKKYNWEAGFKLMTGEHVPGGSVAEQTQIPHNEPHAIFDTRDSRLGNFFEKGHQ
jgi:hypothetical protein